MFRPVMAIVRFLQRLRRVYRVTKKLYTLLQHFGGFDSVWMPIVANSKNYLESKIQGHLSYKFCFCINTVVTIVE